MKTTFLSLAIGFSCQSSFCQPFYATSTPSAETEKTKPDKSTVRYHSFDASLNQKTVTCSWVTTEETNLNYFELESSFDGINFKTAALFFGNPENDHGSQHYAFKDRNAAFKTNDLVFYRLKQIGIDSLMQYSKQISVKLSADAVDALGVQPNPFEKNFAYTFKAPTDGFVITRIISLNGRKLLTTHSAVTKGVNTLQISDTSNFPKGIFFVEVTMNGNVIGRQKINKV